MNTVKIGDAFELKSKRLIKKAFDNNEFSIDPAHCTVKEKVKYYSIKRKGNIIFDLSIEVKHPKADKPFLVCIVECKNLSKPVPVDDIEEFESKVDGIKEFQTKKIVIAKKGFQSGAYKTADTLGVTLINVNEDDYEIVLYKPDKQSNKDAEYVKIEDKIETLIKSALLPNKIEGLKRLSANEINGIAVSFLDGIDENITAKYLKTPLNRIIDYLKKEKSLKIIDYNYLIDGNGKEQLGYYDVKNKTIFISPTIRKTMQFPFVLAHEIGHFVLHSELKSNQIVYDNFKDSEYNLFEQKNRLMNDKNWIEWQANCFAACLLMPKKTILAWLINIQLNKGIRNQGKIYLDHQHINKKDHREIIEELAEFFDVSKISVEYRLESIGAIEEPSISKEDDNAKEFLRRLSLGNM